MPTYPAIGYPTGETAGTQVSSTYEGRHLKVLESTLIHPDYIADPLVDKGQQVCTSSGGIVGVAFNSAAANTDYIEIDTEGVWNLTVTGTHSDGTGDGATSAVVIGDPLFINITDGTLTKESDPSTHLPFGYALGAVAAGAETVIAVKVHWDPSVWGGHYVGVFGGPLEVDVNAIGVGGQNNVGGLLRAFISSSTAIDADEQLYGLSIRVNNSEVADAGTVTGGEFKCVQDATNTTQLAQIVAVKANCDTRGEGAIHHTGIEVLMEGAGTASDNRQGIRFIGRDQAGTLEAAFAFETTTTLGCVASDTLATPSGTIAVNFGGTIHYLQLYST